MTFSEFEPPMDHIFGDMDDPKNTSAWLIARHQGVHHYNIIGDFLYFASHDEYSRRKYPGSISI